MRSVLGSSSSAQGRHFFDRLLLSIISAEGAMYAAIRQAKAKPGMADQLADRIKDASPIISSVHGFMG